MRQRQLRRSRARTPAAEPRPDVPLLRPLDDERSPGSGRCTRSASSSGMGFDTATEVALLATTALLATQHLPFYSIICLPILFTAGMSLMDTIDGIFMNFAYSLGVLQPGPQGLLQPRDHRPLGRRSASSSARSRCSACCRREIGGLHGGFWSFMARLRHQQGGLRDRRHVRPLLGGRARVLEIWPRRGEVERPAPTRDRHDRCSRADQLTLRSPRGAASMRARPRADVATDTLPGRRKRPSRPGHARGGVSSGPGIPGQARAHLRAATSADAPPLQKRAGRRVSLRGPAWRISASMAEAGIGRAK